MATLELVVSEFIILALVCFFLMRHYKGNMVTFDVAAAVYLSWVLGFAGILLLPYDLSVAVVDDQQSDTLEKVWNFIYWSTFILAWVVLPMQMEYHNSGEFTFTEKLKDALRKNVWSGVLAAVAGLVYVGYMMATSTGSLSQVIGFVKAMGNTYGILLITVLMGNGLVGLPRRMWYYADPEMELNWLYMMASSVETTYQEARFELEDCEWDVSKVPDRIRKSNISSDDPVSTGEYVALLQQSVANFAFLSRSTTRNYVNRTVDDSNLAMSDPKRVLCELHGRLKQSQIRARACERRWRHLVQQCARAEIALSDETNAVGDESSVWCLMQTVVTPEATQATHGGIGLQSTAFSCSNCRNSIVDLFHQVFNAKYMKLSSRIFSVICGIVSVIILWSELVMATEWRSPVGYLMGAYNPPREKSAIVMQAVSFLALSYMSICTYWSLFRLNLGWAYTLQGPQLSPPSSLVFNGEYFSRLQFALGYNFLMFLNVPRTRQTSFDRLMSNMTMIPVFGTSFQVYIPIVIIIVALMTLFNVNTRVLRLIGVESDDTYTQTGSFFNACYHSRTKVALNDEDLERYEAGKKLVASEVRLAAQSLSHGMGHSQTPSANSSQKSLRESRDLLDSSRDARESRGGEGAGHKMRNSRIFDSSCMSMAGTKDEAPYRDEEPEDSGSEIEMEGHFMGFATDGRKEGRHKKSSSINYITNDVNPMNQEKGINNESKNGFKGSKSVYISPTETTSNGNNWFAKTLTAKLSEVFNSIPTNPFSQSQGHAVIPLARSESASSEDVPGSYKAVRAKEREMARNEVTSSGLPPYRDTMGVTKGAISPNPRSPPPLPPYRNMNDVELGLDFGAHISRLRGSNESISEGVNGKYYKDIDSKIRPTSDTYYKGKEKKSSSSSANNFGLDDEPEEQFSSRRYANV